MTTPRAGAPRRPILRRLLLVLVAALLGNVVAASAQEPTPPQPGADQGAITWGIRPSSPTGPDGRDRFDLVLEPGEAIEDFVGVSNFTAAPLELAVYASDAFTTADGGFDLLPAAEAPVDAGSWVTFAEESVTIPARSRLDIPFRLAVPDNATPGDHAAGIVASLVTTSEDGSDNPISIDRRVGARVYLRVTGDIEPAATITDVDIDHRAAGLGGDAEVTYTVTNTGNLRLAGTPTIAVAGLLGMGRQRSDGPRIEELLPGDELTFTASVDGVLPLGRLRATVQFAGEGIGDDTPVPPVSASATVWAVPWLHVLLILAASAVALFFVRRRRTRRRRMAEQLDAARAEGRADAAAAGAPSSR